MPPRIVSGICLILVGLAVGMFWSPLAPGTGPTGDMKPRVATVEAGMSVDVDVLLTNRPRGARIAWRSDKGSFRPELTETELRSTFIAPHEQGRVRLWVDVVDGARVYSDVASTVIDVSRSARPPDSVSTQPGDPPRVSPGPDDVTIRLTTIPGYSRLGGPATSADIEGYVAGLAQPDQYRIVIYVRTENTWWVQPLAAAPFTALNARGEFFNWTHTGTHYAVLLVTKEYVPPAAVDGSPPSGPSVLKSIQVEGQKKGD